MDPSISRQDDRDQTRGSLLDDERSLNHLLLDVIFMESVGMRPVIVHGEAKRLVERWKRQELSPGLFAGVASRTWRR